MSKAFSLSLSSKADYWTCVELCFPVRMLTYLKYHSLDPSAVSKAKFATLILFSNRSLSSTQEN